MHRLSIRAVLAAIALLATAAQAQTVKPPPLPPGASLVRMEPGMSEPERKRYVRAHHHKAHHGRDYTRDDSIHGHPHEVAAHGPAAAPAAAGAQGPAARSAGNVIGGPGSGPAREQTGRGASSYFYGTDKK